MGYRWVSAKKPPKKRPGAPRSLGRGTRLSPPPHSSHTVAVLCVSIIGRSNSIYLYQGRRSIHFPFSREETNPSRITTAYPVNNATHVSLHNQGFRTTVADHGFVTIAPTIEQECSSHLNESFVVSFYKAARAAGAGAAATIPSSNAIR